MFSSIKFKFTLWYLGLLSTILLLLGTGIYLSLSRQLYQNLDTALATRAVQLTRFKDIIAIVSGGTFEDTPGEWVCFFFDTAQGRSDISLKGRRINVNDAWISRILNGESLYTTLNQEKGLRVFGMPYVPPTAGERDDNKHWARGQHMDPPRQPPPRETDRALADHPGQKRPPRPGNAPPRPEFSRPHKNREIPRAALVVASSSAGVDQALEGLMGILILALPLTLALSGWGGLFLLNRILKPVDEITRTASSIQETDLSQRIQISTRDELGTLAQTLNQMISRLEKAFARQRELTGDASHELRAPLAVIQAEATLALQRKRDSQAYEKSLLAIAGEAAHMSGLIGQLLFLARSDAGQSMGARDWIDISQLVRMVCKDIGLLCREKHLSLNVNAPEALFVKGDARSLKRLVLNLLANAVRYTPKGGKIMVSLGREKNKAVLTVRDTGIGIPEDSLPRIFDRFYRVDKARSREAGGSGLGLAIVRQIVEDHQGIIRVRSSPGQGSSFRILLVCRQP